METERKSASAATADSIARLERFAGQSREEAARSEVIRKMPPWMERAIVYWVAGAVAVTFALLFFGQVHVSVTAKGRILPEGDVVVVQALQSGVVNAVLARPGERVSAGNPLVRLDVSESGINLAELKRKEAVQVAQLESLRNSLRAVRQALADPENAATVRHPNLTGMAMQSIANLEEARRKLAAARQELARAPERRKLQQREIELTKENISINEKNFRLQQAALEEEERLLKQKAEQLASFRALAEKKLISSFELSSHQDRYRSEANNLLSLRQRLDQQAIDISNQKLRLADLELKAQNEERDRRRDVESAEMAYQQSLAALRRDGAELESQILEAETALATQRERIGLAERNVALTTIAAPVSGTISALKIGNAGELVSAGAVVASIAPEGAPLVVEASLPNKDVGFVRPGLDARIKVDAYPFEQFGVVPARVEHVLPGNDANFLIKLRLLEDRIRHGGSELYLFPGLAVEADMLTGKQRLIRLLFKKGDEEKK